MARPFFESSTIRSHSFSRTRASKCPTNTPGDISNSHRVRSPRKPTGHAVNTITTIPHIPTHHRHRIFLQILLPAVHPTVRHDPQRSEHHRRKILPNHKKKHAYAYCGEENKRKTGTARARFPVCDCFSNVCLTHMDSTEDHSRNDLFPHASRTRNAITYVKCAPT